MTTKTTSSTQSARLTGKQIALNGLIAIVVAIVANIIVRLILGALARIPAEFPPMQVTSIAFFTAFYGIGATVVYWIINRFAGNPQRAWLIVVIIAFVLASLPNVLLSANPAAAPFPGGTAQLFLLLIVYHVVALIVFYFLIPRRR